MNLLNRFKLNKKNRIIQKAYKELHKYLPPNSFVVCWNSTIGAFVVKTDDEDIYDSHTFSMLYKKLERELFDKARRPVFFVYDSLDNNEDDADFDFGNGRNSLFS